MPIDISEMHPSDYREVHALWESTPGVGLDASDAEPRIVLAHNLALVASAA